MIDTFFDVHAHTEYSNIRLIDCINHPKDLINRAIEIGLSGCSITDHEALCSHMIVNKYAKEIKEICLEIQNSINEYQRMAYENLNQYNNYANNIKESDERDAAELLKQV